MNGGKHTTGDKGKGGDGARKQTLGECGGDGETLEEQNEGNMTRM